MYSRKIKLIFRLSIFLSILLFAKIGIAHASAPVTAYDRQEWLEYSNANQGTTLSTTVQAEQQPDDDAGGQAYLLNGYTNSNYWYQWGLQKNWEGRGCTSGQFMMIYAVLNPAGEFIELSCINFLNSNGGIEYPNVGDTILLTMSIQSGEVVMTATDENNHAAVSDSFSAYGATQFVGDPDGSAAYITGLMSEQYFTNPTWYLPNTQVETYLSINNVQPAWLGQDEKECGNIDTEFDCGSQIGPDLYYFDTSQPIDPSPIYEMNSNGLVDEYSNDGTYYTGLFSALDLYVQNNQVQQGQPIPISGTQYTNAQQLQLMQFELINLQNQVGYPLNDPPTINPSYIICGSNGQICPDSPGKYNLLLRTIDQYDAATQTVNQIITITPPDEITPQDCPNNPNQVGINGYTGTGSPSTGVEPDCNTCPNGAVNPNGQGFAGVPNSGCNVFCPDSQINYAGGPGNDLPCSLCPDGTITTGKCPSFFPSDGGTDISGSGCSPPGDPTIMYVGDYMQQCPSSSQCPNFAYDAPQCNACPGGTSVSGAQDMCPENPINCVLDDGTGSACQQCNFEYVISSGQQCPGNGSPPNYHNLSGGGCGIVQQGPNSTAGHNVNSLIWIVSSSGSLGFGCGIVQQGNLTGI
ncbi:MAG: hypothetical protein ABR981_02565 [Candidatus Micrarchaeaceae archaeon]